MRNLCAALLAVFLASTSPLAAAVADASGQTTAKPENGKQRLDKLFSDLKHERDDKAAERIVQQIWAEWFQSGSATIDLLVQWSGNAVKAQQYNAALDFLDQVTTLAPNYAEGWNQRATVHFLMNNYAKSMADIDKTLSLEPRHFGALSGMAAILESTGRKQKALEAYEKVLAIFPMDRAAQAKVEALTQDLAGEGI